MEWKKAREQAAEGRTTLVQAALLNPEDRPLSFGGYAPEVLRAAVAFLDRNGDFFEAMQAAVAFAEPANYCPVLVGSIGGARWRNVPPGMLGQCPIRERVVAAVNALACLE